MNFKVTSMRERLQKVVAEAQELKTELGSLSKRDCYVDI
jgi:hypothetical protein